MRKYLNISAVRVSLVILLTLVVTLVSIHLLAKTSFKYDSLSFNLSAKIGITGGTKIVIPPVGQLYFKSHLTPWQLIVTLEEIDFVKLEKHLNSFPPKQEWLTMLQSGITSALIKLFMMMILVGILTTGLLMLSLRIFPHHRLFWLNIASSLMIIILLITTTIVTYDEKAIDRPQYQGVLASAPWAMNLITMSLDNIEVIGNNLKKISQGIPMLYRQAGQIKTMGELQTDLAVLHVSDIHNNPAAFDFISELVTNFNVNYIIDTGDLTDYGTALEAEIINKISEIKVPYVFIPGNHDSPLIINRLKTIKSVTILQNKSISLQGLTIAGQEDPASTSYNSDVASVEDMQQSTQRLVEQVNAMTTVPEIVAVHERRMAEPLIGKVPLILHGHDHRYNLKTIENTVINDAGTTGSAGIRGLTEKGVPYSAAIIYWKKDQNDKMQLHAIDSIKIDGVEGKLTIVRNTFPVSK